MNKVLVLSCLLLLSACSTPQVTQSCNATHDVLQLAAPFRAFILASPEAGIALLILEGGSYVCGTPEYAKARETVLDWIRKHHNDCLLYTSPSPRDRQKSRMPSSA